MKRKLGITATILIILGFGMIHGSNRNVELLGIGFIGISCSYLLYLLYTSNKQNQKNN